MNIDSASHFQSSKKLQLFELVKSGLNRTEICLKLNISQMTYYNWKKELDYKL